MENSNSKLYCYKENSKTEAPLLWLTLTLAFVAPLPHRGTPAAPCSIPRAVGYIYETHKGYFYMGKILLSRRSYPSHLSLFLSSSLSPNKPNHHSRQRRMTIYRSNRTALRSKSNRDTPMKRTRHLKNEPKHRKIGKGGGGWTPTRAPQREHSGCQAKPFTVGSAYTVACLPSSLTLKTSEA